MFKVRYKYNCNPEPEMVYCVRRADDGTTEFLIFQSGEWYWADAYNFEPYVEDEA